MQLDRINYLVATLGGSWYPGARASGPAVALARCLTMRETWVILAPHCWRPHCCGRAIDQWPGAAGRAVAITGVRATSAVGKVFCEGVVLPALRQEKPPLGKLADSAGHGRNRRAGGILQSFCPVTVWSILIYYIAKPADAVVGQPAFAISASSAAPWRPV